MANEFLINKWKMWFRKILDVNHDGKLSMEDVEESRNKFCEMHHLDAAKGKDLKEKFTKVWEEFIFRGRKGDIFEEEFVDGIKKDFNADKDKFKREMDKCMNLYFSAVDINKDKFISKEEFQVTFKSLGLEKVDSFFAAYNPKDGLIPFRVIVDSWIDFVTSTDETKANIVKTVFEAEGFK